MKMTNDAFISQNDKYWFRHCSELGIYMKNKDTFEIEKINLKDKEFKHLCYGR